MACFTHGFPGEFPASVPPDSIFDSARALPAGPREMGPDRFVAGQELFTRSLSMPNDDPIKGIASPFLAQRASQNLWKTELAYVQADVLVELLIDGLSPDRQPPDFAEVLDLQ